MNNLPQSVRDWIDVVGVTPALALVKSMPGLILKVPTGAREEGVTRARLIGIMGLEAADKFISIYQGERLTVPRCVKALRDERNQRIINAYGDGKSVPSLALEHGLNERQIRNILCEVPGDVVAGLGQRSVVDDRQLGLF